MIERLSYRETNLLGQDSLVLEREGERFVLYIDSDFIKNSSQKRLVLNTFQAWLLERKLKHLENDELKYYTDSPNPWYLEIIIDGIAYSYSSSDCGYQPNVRKVCSWLIDRGRYGRGL